MGKQETNPFITGPEAIRIAGYPIEFVSLLMLNLNPDKGAVAVRCGQVPRVDTGLPVSFKPMSVKTKTTTAKEGGNLIAGFLAKDQQHFGRAPFKPFPLDAYFTPLKINSSELIAALYGPHAQYDIISQDDERLIFKPKSNFFDPNVFPDGPPIFVIKLNEGIPAPSINIFTILPWTDNKDTTVLSVPEALKNKTFELHQIINHTVVPFQVLADREGRMITGDADLLWICSYSKDIAQIAHRFARHPDEYNKPFRADNIQDRFELLNLAMELILGGAIPSFSNPEHGQSSELALSELYNRLNTFIPMSGITTAYEAVYACSVNHIFSTNAQHQHLGDLIQHGPETNNPGHPSPLDSNMLHIWRGMVFLTRSEDELIAFVMQDGYLEENHLNIHPEWDMQKWSPVIDRQFDLGRSISEQTLAAYNRYQHHEAPTKPVQQVNQAYLKELDQLNPIVKNNKSGSNSDDLTQNPHRR